MENLTETITEKRTHNGEAQRREVVKEQKFWTAKISWPAIFSGVLVTAVSQILFSLLGLGIGLATVDPLTETYPADGLGTGTIVWWSFSMLVSLFLGGWTTGKMYIPKLKGDLSMHGFLTWAAFTVFSFIMLATSAGRLISGTGNFVSTALTTAAAANRTDNLDISTLTNEARNVLLQSRNANTRTGGGTTTDRTAATEGVINADLAPAGVANQSAANVNNQQMFISSVESSFRRGDIENPQTREAMINSLVNQTDMSRNEATAKVDQWIKTYAEIKGRAVVAADRTAKLVSIASIIGFFALIIGAFITVGGARFAQRKIPVTVRP